MKQMLITQDGSVFCLQEIGKVLHSPGFVWGTFFHIWQQLLLAADESDL